MMLMKWLFLLLAISAIEGSLRVWKPKGFSLEERVTIKILETCYGNNGFKKLIFILGDFNEVLDEASVIRMKNLSNVDEDYESRQFSSVGVTKVLIIEDSPERLHSELISFSQTRWWNHTLPFFIIGKNDETCENFKEMLNTMWRMDLLNAIYICSKSENTTLYTLNLFTNYAPDPWKRMEHLNDSNIYHQVFDSHTSCNNLNYDKTKVLNGYQIKAVIYWIPENVTMADFIDSLKKNPKRRLFHLIIRQLNASLIYESAKIFLHHLHDSRKSHADVILDQLSIVSENRQLFPGEGGYQHVVLYKTRYSWSTHVLYGTVIALIILFFILVIKNGGVTSAILDIIRFLTYGSIRTDTRSNSFRIYFTTMLILIVISNAVFQGQIAAFLATQDKVPPMKTIEELVDSGYFFYIFDPEISWWSFQVTPLAVTRIIASDEACINYVLNGSLNACILPGDLYREKHSLKPLDSVRLWAEDIHLSRWVFQTDWPLYERFRNIFMRVIESGIYKKWKKEGNKWKTDDHKLTLPETTPQWRSIELDDLDFAFKLLTAGLSIAMFVLIVELRMQEI